VKYFVRNLKFYHYYKIVHGLVFFFLVVYMDWVLPKRNQDQVVNPRLDLGNNQHTIKKFIQLLPTAKVQNQQWLPTAEIHPIPNYQPLTNDLL